jgi:amino acid transporter
VIIRSGVIFAYAAVELVGTAAGETADPAKVMPKAINSVVFRIAVFCVGSLILLGLLLPYTAHKKGTRPFVTFFSTIGVPAAGDIMNFVVLTAGLSSLKAGSVLHRSHPSVDVLDRQYAKIHRQDDETWCAVCRRRARRALHRGARHRTDVLGELCRTSSPWS